MGTESVTFLILPDICPLQTICCTAKIMGTESLTFCNTCSHLSTCTAQIMGTESVIFCDIASHLYCTAKIMGTDSVTFCDTCSHLSTCTAKIMGTESVTFCDKVLHFVTKCYILWQSVTFCDRVLHFVILLTNHSLDAEINRWISGVSTTIATLMKTVEEQQTYHPHQDGSIATSPHSYMADPPLHTRNKNSKHSNDLHSSAKWIKSC